PPLLTIKKRIGNLYQIRDLPALMNGSGQAVHKPVVSHCDGIDVTGPAPIRIKNWPMISVCITGNVIRYQMYVFNPSRRTFRDISVSADPLSILIDWPAGKVINRFSIGPELET